LIIVLLQYLYFAEIEINGDIVNDLFLVAHEYMLDDLKADCEEVLSSDLKVENVIQKIQFATTYEAHNMRKACLSFIKKNLDEVFKTQNIKELDNETLLELHKN